MNGTLLRLPGHDQVRRRAMFALELVDPVTGRFAGAEMEVSLGGYRAPVLTSEGRLVWTDVEPPAARRLTLRGVSRKGRFAPFEARYRIPERGPKQAPADLVRRRLLKPTGLYEPPPGTLAVAGMLVEDESTRAPVAAASIRLQLRDSDTAIPLGGRRAALSDPRGGFVAAMGDLGHETPAPAPGVEGGLVGWVRVRRAGMGARYSPAFPLRAHRLYRLPAPLVWADLALAPP